MVDVSKMMHFVFFIIITILLVRVVEISLLGFSKYSLVVFPFSSSLFWLTYVILTFATIYFPFTSGAFNFHILPFKEKFFKFLRNLVMIDLVLGVLGVLGFIPSLFCSPNSECYIILYFRYIWIALGRLIIVQVLTFVIIFLMYPFKKTSSKIRYLLFTFIILVLIFFNFNAHLIIYSPAAKYTNEFFMLTNQCNRLNIFDISVIELGENGCHNFYMFDESGNPYHPYKNVAPINAFRRCYTRESERVDGETYTLHYVDCKTMASGSDVFIENQAVYDVVSRKYMEKYGFNEDDSYFEACKTILTDYINKKKKECFNRE